MFLRASLNYKNISKHFYNGVEIYNRTSRFRPKGNFGIGVGVTLNENFVRSFECTSKGPSNSMKIIESR